MSESRAPFADVVEGDNTLRQSRYVSVLYQTVNSWESLLDTGKG